MIQILMALSVISAGMILICHAFARLDIQRGYLKFMTGVVFAGLGVLWIAGVLFCVAFTHIGIDSEVAKYEQIKIAMRSAKAGDAMYSGVLLEAVQWNASISIARNRIHSAWWGIYYNQQIADLAFIEMPGERK